MGDQCKVGNYACIYHPAIVGRNVFIGPGAILTNDKHPRAANQDGSARRDGDWVAAGVNVGNGASIGAGATIVAGVTIGAHAVIGAGAVVTKDVPSGETWVGAPAARMSP